MLLDYVLLLLCVGLVDVVVVNFVEVEVVFCVVLGDFLVIVVFVGFGDVLVLVVVLVCVVVVVVFDWEL